MKFKKFLSVALSFIMIFGIILFSPFEVSAETQYKSGYYTYTVSNDDAIITGCDTSISGEVNIPSSLGGFKVIGLGAEAFKDCCLLTSIIIPDNVMIIGGGAFENCSSLISITIPDSVSTIGCAAFTGCSALKQVNITDIAAWCEIEFAVLSLMGFIPDTNPLSIAENLYINGTLATDIIIPKNVTKINSYAFYGYNSLTSVIIPDNVKSVGDKAFYGCGSLTSITISENVLKIGKSAFENSQYYNNTENWKNGVLYIGNHLIRGSKTISEYVIKDGTKTIADGAFYFGGLLFTKISLTLISIPDSLISIGDSAFSGCEKLTTITMPDGVTNIGNSAFYNCSSLANISISDSLISIGDSAFSGCEKLTTITMPDGVTNIGNSAFYNCSSLANISISDSLISIGDDAFSGCKKLTTITIPDSVTSIGDGAFNRCSLLNSIIVEAKNSFFSSQNGILFDKEKSELIRYPQGKKGVSYIIPNTVEKIDNYAFYSCSSLTDVSIPDSVINIGNSAFYNCSSLTNISISNSVISIGDGAFNNCENLTIYCNNNSYAKTYAEQNNIKYVIENIIVNHYNDEAFDELLSTETLFKEIATEYPNYLRVSEVRDYYGTISSSCYDMIQNYYSHTDIVKFALIEGFFNGSEIVSTKLLSFLGAESTEEKWLKNTTTIFLKEFQSNEFVINDVWETINEEYEGFEEIYELSEGISKSLLVDFINDRSINIPRKDIISIVDNIFEEHIELGIGKAFDIAGKAFDMVDITVGLCQLYDFEIMSIDRLLALTDSNTPLHQGLLMIKKDIESNPYMYVSKHFINKQVISKLNKLYSKAGKLATTKFNMNISVTLAIVTTILDIYYEYLYEGPKLSDIYEAIILTSFRSTLEGIEIELRTNFLKAKMQGSMLYEQWLKDYKLVWDAEISSLKCLSESCSKLAERDFEKTFFIKQAENIKSELNFEKYIEICNRVLKEDVANGTIKCGHFRGCPIRTVASSCSSLGYTINYCLTCSKEYVVDIESKDGHNYSSHIINPTCNKQGYTIYSCNNCRHSYNDNFVSALGHNYTEYVVESTCVTRGYTNHICSTCNYTYSDNYKDICGHSYSGWVTEYDSTCSQYGSVYNDCSICNDRIYAKISKKAHIPSSNWITSKEPTICEEGLKQQLCSVCSEVVNEETINKLIYYGDTNGDGVISTMDLVEMRITLLTSSSDTEYNESYDANGDEKIDILDFIRLKKYLVGMDVTLGK